MCQRKENIQVGVFFHNVIGMGTDGILKTKVEDRRRSKFLGGRAQILQHVLDMLLHISQIILEFRFCGSAQFLNSVE